MAKVRHSEETINRICELRKAKLSYEKISKETGLTKNVVLALAYKHLLKIDRHKVYKDRDRVAATPLANRELRPSVPFVIGLNDTRYYVVRTTNKGDTHAVY